MPQENGSPGIQVESGGHSRWQGGPGQLGQQFAKVNRGYGALGKAAELGKLTGELLKAPRLGHQDLDDFLVLGSA